MSGPTDDEIDQEVERLFAMSDAEVIAEAKKEHGEIGYTKIIFKTKRIINNALRKAGHL